MIKIIGNKKAVGSSSRFLLSLFLLLPVTTQCMKRSRSQITESENNSLHIPKKIERTKIQSLKEERELLKAELDKELFYSEKNNERIMRNNYTKDYTLRFLGACLYPHYEHTYVSDHDHPSTYIFTPMLCSIDLLKEIGFHEARYKQYSVLGVVAMAEEISHQEKKDFIQKLLTAGCKPPTNKDKQFALLAQHERQALIDERRWLLQHSQFLSKIKVSQKIIDYISLLMFEMEMLL